MLPEIEPTTVMMIPRRFSRVKFTSSSLLLLVSQFVNIIISVMSNTVYKLWNFIQSQCTDVGHGPSHTDQVNIVTTTTQKYICVYNINKNLFWVIKKGWLPVSIRTVLFGSNTLSLRLWCHNHHWCQLPYDTDCLGTLGLSRIWKEIKKTLHMEIII